MMVHYCYIINVEKTYMIKMDKATLNLKHQLANSTNFGKCSSKKRKGKRNQSLVIRKMLHVMERRGYRQVLWRFSLMFCEHMVLHIGSI
jgi:hypothetical protein